MAEDRAAKLLESLMAQTKQASETQDIIGYLESRKAMPPVEMKGTLSGGVGEFQFRNGEAVKNFPVGPEGKIRLQNIAAPNTLLHELTHAADHQIRTQYYEAPWVDNQFTRAYKKMGQDSRPMESVERINPKRKEGMSSYRSSQSEMKAFAVGNSVFRNNRITEEEDKIAPHTEATMATEFMILLDLANRNPSPKPTK